jgi:hypothetical protein
MTGGKSYQAGAGLKIACRLWNGFESGGLTILLAENKQITMELTAILNMGCYNVTGMSRSLGGICPTVLTE